MGHCATSEICFFESSFSKMFSGLRSVCVKPIFSCMKHTPYRVCLAMLWIVFKLNPKYLLALMNSYKDFPRVSNTNAVCSSPVFSDRKINDSNRCTILCSLAPLLFKSFKILISILALWLYLFTALITLTA